MTKRISDIGKEALQCVFFPFLDEYTVFLATKIVDVPSGPSAAMSPAFLIRNNLDRALKCAVLHRRLGHDD